MKRGGAVDPSDPEALKAMYTLWVVRIPYTTSGDQQRRKVCAQRIQNLPARRKECGLAADRQQEFRPGSRIPVQSLSRECPKLQESAVEERLLRG
ncbi:hypothetical protein RvY_05867 [Ramazzottius varieornatus]|uniref:Uncharacterized protein n=1 Tax=Ramazzottius varieornatus TaxID=947166 RepID=A0A1D1UWJ1_RAMVA|nr:hypothetical protein RvY_05867 [Ramazzottius varieornatus]